MSTNLFSDQATRRAPLCARLAPLPTPLEALLRLGAALGGQHLHVKRDRFALKAVRM
jgi:hypothetical protein